MSADSMSEVETTVRRFYEALNTGDATLVDQALAPGWEAIPALRTGPGADGWKASITHLRGVFTDLSVTIEDVVVSAGRAAVRSVNRGIHTGELLGVPGTGKQIEFRATDIHRLENGRIVQTWHLEDYFGIATQIGLTFTPAS
jgi:predicted ester cyclase